MLFYFFFIICLIEVVINTVIQNESDLISSLSEEKEKVTLSINSKIDVTEEIEINKSIKKLSFIGNSLDHSKLYLSFPLYFKSSLEEIEITNININGTLVFNNNKNITFNSVNLNGYIDSNFDKKTTTDIKISKLIYKPTGDLVRNCINLSGNVTIVNSYFFGDSSCQNRLIHYNGLDQYSLNLKESIFNGEYLCPFLSIENAVKANIETSTFEKGYSSENIDGGVAVISKYSYLIVKNCIFNDIVSYNNGGAFNLYNNKRVRGSNLSFNNVTSLAMGSICHISSEFPSELYLYNITQKNTGNLENMRGGGLILNIEQQVDVEVDLYHAENLINKITSGAAFVISEYSKLKVSNLYIDTLEGHGERDGLFYTSHDSFKIEFKASNVVLNNLYQTNRKSSSVIYVEYNNHVTLENVKILNSGGYNTNLIYQLDNAAVKIDGIEVDNFNSTTSKELVYYEQDSLKFTGNNILDIYNSKLSNIVSQGVIFRIKNGVLALYNGEFRNIHVCVKYNNCKNIPNDDPYIQHTGFIYSEGEKCALIFKNIIIDNFNAEFGVVIFNSSVSIMLSVISNSYFKNGFFHMDERIKECGILTIKNTNFMNNTSENGTILNVPFLNSETGSSINFNSCYFSNNTASNFGGVINSMGEYNNKHMKFTNNQYSDNHAKLGNIIYGYSKNSFPSIGNINKSDKTSLPSTFKLDNTTYSSISILSGQNIPGNITVHLYDEFGKQMYFPHETTSLHLEDLVFFNVEIDDPSNAAVVGQTRNYCWDDKCVFPPVKVVGNPGTYNLSLKFITFGQYPKFIHDSFSIEIIILKCNTKIYHELIYDHNTLKSCFIPKCHKSCNNVGECINNDVCDCKDSGYIGKYCDEHEELKRYNILDIIVIIIACAIIYILIMLIGFTIYYKNHSIIKGGGVEFLIIILIGLILNSINTIILTYNKTTYICYQLYLLSNTGFSFVFGSLFVKTLRINIIFSHETKYRGGLKKRDMFLIIAVIAIFHWIVALMWFMFNKISIKDGYTTGDKKVFKRCDYHISKNLSAIFNFIVLVWEIVLSYNIRKVEKIFKEALVIPAYVYIMYVVFINIINSINEINVIIQDYFDIAGSIISTIIIIYDLFIIKFIEINAKGKEDPKQFRKVYKIESSRIDSYIFENSTFH